MRVSFRTMIATWVLSLAVAFGFKMAVHSGGGSSVERGIASLSGMKVASNDPRVLPSGFCLLPESYACEWRVYGPTESDSSAMSRECVDALSDAAGSKQICLQVLRISFHSETVSTNQIPSSEVKCTLRGLSQRSELESEAADLSTAMQILMAKCRNQSSEAR